MYYGHYTLIQMITNDHTTSYASNILCQNGYPSKLFVNRVVVGIYCMSGVRNTRLRHNNITDCCVFYLTVSPTLQINLLEILANPFAIAHNRPNVAIGTDDDCGAGPLRIKVRLISMASFILQNVIGSEIFGGDR